VVIIAEYIHLPFTIGLPVEYYVSFNALTLYVDLGIFFLMILYPKRLLGRFRIMLNQLKVKEVVSEGVAGQMREDARRAIYGRAEKFIPLIFATLIITAFIYNEFTKGTFGVFDFTDMEGNVIYIWNSPLTPFHDTLLSVELFILPILGFSTLIVIWKVMRAMVPEMENINLDVMSPSRAGGLDPIGKLMVEVVLLVMVISTTYAALGAVYYILTSKFHFAILVVVILCYGILLVLMARPVYKIHRIMVKKKKQISDQLKSKIKNLRKQVSLDGLRDLDDKRMGELSSLLQINEEVEKMRTFPLDVSSTRRLIMFILSPALASIPALLEPYLGKTISFIPIVIVFSIITQMISFKFE
jgi:ABC-type multidrug transport system fused ATPase/permease subunit